MGTVLAMMGLRRVTFLAIAVVLASCGPLNKGGTGAVLGQLVVGRISGGAAPAPAPASVPRDEILSNPGKYLRVNIRDVERWDTLVQAGTNGSRVTWVGSSNISVTFESGIVVATRGLPRDLMAADVAQSRAAIRAGGGNTQRIQEFLTDLDSISAELLQCSIVSKGPELVVQLKKTRNSTRFEEVCSGERLTFTNIYWVNGAGQIIRSLQAISPDAGYLQIDVF